MAVTRPRKPTTPVAKKPVVKPEPSAEPTVEPEPINIVTDTTAQAEAARQLYLSNKFAARKARGESGPPIEQFVKSFAAQHFTQ